MMVAAPESLEIEELAVAVGRAPAKMEIAETDLGPMAAASSVLSTPWEW